VSLSLSLSVHLSFCGALCMLKGSPYSIAERRILELIPVLGSQSPGPQLPLQPLRGLLPVSLLGEQRHDGCEQFA